jgi:hypothetical protein
MLEVTACTAAGAQACGTMFGLHSPLPQAARPVVPPTLQHGIKEYRNCSAQDYPGRTGFWHVGVPPSGPMDAAAFRLANALVGNPEDAAGLEVTLSGACCGGPPCACHRLLPTSLPVLAFPTTASP